MTDPFIVGPAAPLEQDPVESFESMDKEINASPDDEPVGNPVLPCKNPFVEVWVTDSEPAPVPDTECSISLPTGKSNSGKLDNSGYVKIPDFDVDDPDMKNVMVLAVADGSGNLEIRFTRDAPVEEEQDQEEDEVAEDPPYYFKPPFDDDSEDS